MYHRIILSEWTTRNDRSVYYAHSPVFKTFPESYTSFRRRRQKNQSPGRDGQFNTPPSQQGHLGLHEALHTHWPLLSSQQTEGVISLSALLDRENQGTQRQNSESSALPYSVLPPWWKLFINGWIVKVSPNHLCIL